MKETDNIKRFSLRIPADLLKQVEEVADSDDRSINYLIVQMVREALAARVNVAAG